MIMPTIFGLTVLKYHNEKKRIINVYVVHFNYPEVLSYHYRYRGSAENQNDFRNYGGTKSQIGLKSAWGTIWWPIQVLLFS